MSILHEPKSDGRGWIKNSTLCFTNNLYVHIIISKYLFVGYVKALYLTIIRLAFLTYSLL